MAFHGDMISATVSTMSTSSRLVQQPAQPATNLGLRVRASLITRILAMISAMCDLHRGGRHLGVRRRLLRVTFPARVLGHLRRGHDTHARNTGHEAGRKLCTSTYLGGTLELRRSDEREARGEEDEAVRRAKDDDPEELLEEDAEDVPSSIDQMR